MLQRSCFVPQPSFDAHRQPVLRRWIFWRMRITCSMGLLPAGCAPGSSALAARLAAARRARMTAARCCRRLRPPEYATRRGKPAQQRRDKCASPSALDPTRAAHKLQSSTRHEHGECFLGRQTRQLGTCKLPLTRQEALCSLTHLEANHTIPATAALTDLEVALDEDKGGGALMI